MRSGASARTTVGRGTTASRARAESGYKSRRTTGTAASRQSHGSSKHRDHQAEARHMNLFRTFKAGLRSLFRREIVERELDDELRHFEEMDAQERMRAGMPADAARRAARLRVGGVSTRERVVEAGWEAP